MLINDNFKLLIVEDESSLSELITRIFLKNFGFNIDITTVTNRNDAFDVLSQENVFYDLVTLDLRIPSSLDDLDADTKHGQSVLGKCYEYIKGTPIILITGTSTVDMIPNFLQTSARVDIWGSGQEDPTLTHVKKEDLDLLTPAIEKIYSQFSKLDSIQLVSSDNNDIPIEYKRLIRIFSQKNSGKIVNIKTLGGLSKAKVYSLEIQDKNDNTILKAVVKCGPHYKIDEDSCNYDKAINRLRPEATPRKIDIIKYGGARCSAVFYSLAEGCNHSFFSASKKNLLDEKTREVLKDLLSEWHHCSHEEHLKIGHIRRMILSDNDVHSIMTRYSLPNILEFEEKLVYCNLSYQHCDLHGENILVNVEKKSVRLIDYGDIREAVRIFDPLMLECSYLFHPDAEKYRWPSEENILNWGNIDLYLEGCPIEDEIRFCRNWLESLKHNDREVSACLYAYSLRQLKFEGTNKRIALNLIQCAFELYDQ